MFAFNMFWFAFFQIMSVVVLEPADSTVQRVDTQKET